MLHRRHADVCEASRRVQSQHPGKRPSEAGLGVRRVPSPPPVPSQRPSRPALKPGPQPTSSRGNSLPTASKLTSRLALMVMRAATTVCLGGPDYLGPQTWTLPAPPGPPGALFQLMEGDWKLREAQGWSLCPACPDNSTDNPQQGRRGREGQPP